MNSYERRGFFVSLLVHATLFYCLIFGVNFGATPNRNTVVYSISLEGSNRLGGIAQVPKGNKKTNITPPKKTAKKQAPQPKQQDKPVEKKVEKQPEVKEKPPKAEEDAEVSLKEKKRETKPKPTPTAVKKVVKPKKTQEKKAAPVKSETKKTSPPPKKSAPKATPVAKKKDPLVQANENYEKAMQRYLGESTNAGGQGFGGDGRGGTGMGGGVVKPPEWFLYKDQLEMAVKRGWNWHDTNQALMASVAFRISPQGQVSEVRLVQGSGNTYYDESIVRAVKKASPVPIPPKEFYDDFKFVELDFEPR